MTKQMQLLAPDPEALSPARRGTLSGQAYDAISTMIEQRRLAAGTVIVEQQIADLLGISRTPLREALQRLDFDDARTLLSQSGDRIGPSRGRSSVC